jgi:hypothetical protein
MRLIWNLFDGCPATKEQKSNLICIYNEESMKCLLVSPAIKKKLQTKHQVSVQEVEQCFQNRAGKLLFDTRDSTQTNPPTLWFIASTHLNRQLKIVYIQKGLKVILKTAYEPNEVELTIYQRHGKAN